MDRFKIYDSINEELSVTDKIKFLKSFKANILLRAHIGILIDNLYIELNNHRGYANEVVKDGLLKDYSNEAATSMIPFFKENDLLIRGLVADDWGRYFSHSWIKFNSHNKEYVFDPSLNIIVSRETYDNAFLPKRLGSASAYQVKKDILKTLDNGKEIDGFKVVDKSDDINSSFYDVDMAIKGEAIRKKILTLVTKYT